MASKEPVAVQKAEVYWLATVRPDGRPHCNALNEGFDVVVEGDAAAVGDETTLRRLADEYATKYGWHF